MLKQYGSLDTNNKLIWNFRDIGHIMRHISEGKGSQKRILILLNEAGIITQRELTKRLGIQPGSVSEVLAKLEAMELITRSLSETDHRTVDLQLTETGKELAKEASSQREARHQEMFSCLSEEEKATLLDLLEKVNLDWKDRFRENKEG